MLKPMYLSFSYLLFTNSSSLCGNSKRGLMAFSFFTATGISNPPASTNTFITFVSNPIYPMFRYPINNTQLVFTYSTYTYLFLIFLNLQHSLKGFVTYSENSYSKSKLVFLWTRCRCFV